MNKATKNLRLRLTVVTLALAVGAGGLIAQPPAAEPGIFGEVLDVRVVNLEVVVTDKEGLPVSGLGAGDFTLRVDDEVVPIDYFSEIRGGVAVEARNGQAGPPGLPALAPGSPVETSYLVFVDEMFTLPRDRNRVLDGLLDQLAHMGPQDRMAIVTYDGRDLEMLSTWSTSKEGLEDVLRAAHSRPAYGLQRLGERRQFDIERLLQSSVEFRQRGVEVGQTLRNLDPNERFYVERLSRQIEGAVTAAAATLRSFAQPPGRKVMLLYSGGWPMMPAEYLIGSHAPTVVFADADDGAALLRPLTDTANQLGYTVYAIDVPGLDAPVIGDVVQGSLSEADLAGVTGGAFVQEQVVHSSLHFISQETGGRALLNADRRQALELVAGDTRTYYWLGFSPAREFDNDRHEIDVRVNNPDFRVRARGDFLDSSRQREVTMAVESALLFGSPSGHGPLAVEVGDAKPAGRRRVEVPLVVRIPLEEVEFLPRGESQVAELELRVALRDEDGRRAEIPVVPIDLEVAAGDLRGVAGKYETRLLLRRQRHDGVVAVYDPLSGRILSSQVVISP